MIRFRKNRRSTYSELSPDDILLDVHNLPEFNQTQFEGRMQRPVPKRSLRLLLGFFFAVAGCFVVRLGYLQIVKHAYYEGKSERNSLAHVPIFADRGVVYDRVGTELAWNETPANDDPTIRNYITDEGFANLLGYVAYPAKDNNGKFYQSRIVGRDGVEKQFDASLAGVNGTRLVETTVSGKVVSGDTIEEPLQGQNLKLSVDARIQSVLYQGIKTLAEQNGYVGGGGAIMNIKTGELIALTTYPEYDQHALSDANERGVVARYLTDSRRPFLNRVTNALYTPGSIIKPFLGLAALEEGLIAPDTVIYTHGSLRVPNPYHPGEYSVFIDNANHGPVDLRKAIAVSSNVYFYEIGGGFGAQPGLGIDRIDRYLTLFDVGQKTGVDTGGELAGTIPSVAWKAKKFPKDPWRIGDTYHTAIGQYGFQVTPIQMLRAGAALASGGTLVTPTILKYDGTKPVVTNKLPFAAANLKVIQEGMRLDVTDGTGIALNNPRLLVAAKTGTAQIKGNTRVNSWAMGFYPYDDPKYAFVVVLEDGPKVSVGATHAFAPVIDLLASNPDMLGR